MEAIPKIRRPKEIHTTDQIVGQASRNGWTVGITMEDLVGAQCADGDRACILADARWLSGDKMAGVWFKDQAERQRNIKPVWMSWPFGQFEAMAVSPLASGRLNPPDICLIYATPAQMILFINGLQWTGYRKIGLGLCGRICLRGLLGSGALKTGEPSLSIPCFAERRYGGVMEDELLMAIPPSFLPKVIAGLEALSQKWSALSDSHNMA